MCIQFVLGKAVHVQKFILIRQHNHYVFINAVDQFAVKIIHYFLSIMLSGNKIYINDIGILDRRKVV